MNFLFSPAFRVILIRRPDIMVLLILFLFSEIFFERFPSPLSSFWKFSPPPPEICFSAQRSFGLLSCLYFFSVTLGLNSFFPFRKSFSGGRITFFCFPSSHRSPSPPSICGDFGLLFFSMSPGLFSHPVFLLGIAHFSFSTNTLFGTRFHLLPKSPMQWISCNFPHVEASSLKLPHSGCLPNLSLLY